MTEPGFQLKGSVLTTIVIELHQYTPDAFQQQLRDKISQAPGLLSDSPVVLDLEKYSDDAANVDLSAVVDQCRAAGLKPVAVRQRAEQDLALAGLDIAVLAPRGQRGAAREAPVAPEISAPVEPPPPQARHQPTRLVTQPVRSGQQIYARDADLIIMSQVSEGAEVLADGNIHVYGSLRGRALAGVGGDTGARIFCHRLEAELLSIAGNFLLSDDLDKSLWKAPVQASLQGERLLVEPLI